MMFSSFFRPLTLAAALALGAAALPALAAAPQGSAPPVVGVIKVKTAQINEQTHITGRVEAEERVELVARVTAYLDEMLFQEGADVTKGQLLYRLERGPFEAEVEARKAEIEQFEAQVENARLAYNRAAELAERKVGPQSTADSTRAEYLSAQAQLRAAKAQLQSSQINLNYTEIRSPIDGRIGRTSVTPGNVVSPSSGTLATIVSQDPMYVVFPMSVRAVLDLRERYAEKGWDSVRIRLRLPDGKMYAHEGRLNFLDVTVARDTDTLTLRAVIDNPLNSTSPDGKIRVRELTDNEFVTVVIESIEPTQVLVVPRAAVLLDQQGSYVYTVDEQNVVQLRRVTMGQSTPKQASIVHGLNEGDRVVIDGLQRLRPNAVVEPTEVELETEE